MNVLIVASAPETEYDYVRELAGQADYIICADGGTRHAAACGIQPDLVVGDFDSGKRPDVDTETITLKPEKDDSDLMCCTREALKRGADVGIIPLDAALQGVTLRGLKYPLTNAEVSRSQVITISNEAAAPEYMISIETGRALVIESKDK